MLTIIGGRRLPEITFAEFVITFGILCILLIIVTIVWAMTLLNGYKERRRKMELIDALLTDKEIQQAVDTVPFENSVGGLEYGQQLLKEYNLNCQMAVAKAQLAKCNETIDDWKATVEAASDPVLSKALLAKDGE